MVPAFSPLSDRGRPIVSSFTPLNHSSTPAYPTGSPRAPTTAQVVPTIHGPNVPERAPVGQDGKPMSPAGKQATQAAKPQKRNKRLWSEEEQAAVRRQLGDFCKLAVVTKVVLRDDERCDDKARVVHLERLLARRTAELAAEKRRVAPLLADKDAEIARLKADLKALRADNDSLRQENQRLRESSHSECQGGELAIMEEVRAGFGELQAALQKQRSHGNVSAAPERPTPRCTASSAASSTSEARVSPSALGDSVETPRQHSDVSLRAIGPKDCARLRHQSYGQVGRFGCLLFRKVISEENYKAWSRTTNWDGSRGKHELPQNVKKFVVKTLRRNFPAMKKKGLKDCINKINEFLRTTRKCPQGLTLL
ncbi:hypothetical protein INR49_026973 [Caranx melampygus]|nr:hypothetical protein INR49_026973 [Caranx melampygus]